MELNINRDIIKWNKLWAKDNQYTSICCLQAQKKLIWIDNVSDLTFPSSATTMMMMLTCVSMFICLKNLCQSPNYCGWCHLPCAVGQCWMCQALSLVSLRAVRAHLETEAHRLEILESQGGTQQQATEKIYFAKQIQSLGGKNSICLRTGLCSVDFLR